MKFAGFNKTKQDYQQVQHYLESSEDTLSHPTIPQVSQLYDYCAVLICFSKHVAKKQTTKTNKKIEKQT